MTSFKDFCERYGLDRNSDEARKAYREAQENLRALYSVASQAEAAEAVERAKADK